MKIFPQNTQTQYLHNPEASLSELANLYQTDKGTADASTLPWSKDYPIHKCWHYTKVYEKYMANKRNESINMLEIGICDKRFPYASVKMWLSYFKSIHFYAMDNFWGHSLTDKLNDIYQLNNLGTTFIYGDQGNFEDWDILSTTYPGKFDFIVEDGSHWPNHMMISLWKSIPIIKPGGYYFMEDIQNPLVSRGWFKYDNALIAQELLETFFTKELSSSFLNNDQNQLVQQSYELVDLVLDPHKIQYLAVFKRK